ncbi:unnamed protein product [Phytophthora lilii]|uniref:Unnamed protein product n=1 Tax=Phytophthora lilii TaxID=2077276 RepID=A0A9W6X4J7_9STRA|nr:unnamed protein product [Phytophthora lilii]
MISFRVRRLLVIALIPVISPKTTTATTAFNLVATVLYGGEDDSSCKGAIAPALKVTAVLDEDPISCVSSTTCTGTNAIYPATYCLTSDESLTGDFYGRFLPEHFGMELYVAVKKYKIEPAELVPESITVYLADEIPHNWNSTSNGSSLNDSTPTPTTATASASANGCAASTTTSTSGSGTEAPPTTATIGERQCHLLWRRCVVVQWQWEFPGSSAPQGRSTVPSQFDHTQHQSPAEEQQIPWLPPQTKPAKPRVWQSGDLDIKIFGSGVTPLVYSAVTVYAGDGCGTPVEMAESESTYCTPFEQTAYIIQERHTESTGECKLKEGALVYATDGKCHVALDGATSFTATLKDDGSGMMATYGDKGCEDTNPYTTLISAEQISTHTCTESSRYYAFNASTSSQDATTAPTATIITGSGESSAIKIFCLSSPLALLAAAAMIWANHGLLLLEGILFTSYSM